MELKNEVARRKCNICNYENKSDEHYCKKCGKNLSSIIELTDVLFFFSVFFKWCIIFILLFIIPGLIILENLGSLDGGSVSHLYSFYLFLICCVFFIMSLILKKYALCLCNKNIGKC